MSLKNVIISAGRVTPFGQPSDTQQQAVLKLRECLPVEVVRSLRLFSTVGGSFLCLRKYMVFLRNKTKWPVPLVGCCVFPG